MREEYGSRELRRKDLAADPISQFEQWFAEAREAELHEPNALTLSTVRLDGYPSSRTVLMSFSINKVSCFTQTTLAPRRRR